MSGTGSTISSRLLYFVIALVATSWSNGSAADGEPIIRFPASESALRDELIKITPLGTKANEVSAFVEKEMRSHGETQQSVIDQNAQLSSGPALIRKPNDEARGARYVPIGVKHITAVFKWPSIAFILVIPVAAKNVVEVDYAFDANDRLVDIGVAKWVEGLP